ncbi:cysteine desulfurase family protein (TIGR01976 family) [Microbacterium testaceum]|uniref:cysteine desulfurase-like protein n=1 Tax=Microbacterium TaxID=33882 RepID=UPI0027834798|nr:MULTISPECIES: cysteine desulfurase-like protein [Microbacterium]MDQ1112374.1 cysteine desulfurase family protein (TIGR01976 family) [Microbacterium testaceum]MDR6097087.1 cysteine desulfurase family protein (TIGR01976 family) [Microbacterium sp. SORGH_AS_0454]
MKPSTVPSTLDVDDIRSHFPALRGGTAFFDSPGGTQTPTSVAAAIGEALLAPLANRGLVTQAERNATSIVEACRSALGDFLNVPSQTVVFGRSATALTFDLSRAISRTWKAGDEVVVTRLDHNSNAQPWLIAAERTGVTVRWVDFDPATGELSTDAVREQLSERTRLVAVTAASNVLGTMPDIPRIAEAVHGVGALLYVDGVHYAAHALVDVPALGADFFVCSPYKFLGPHCAAVTMRSDLLGQLQPDKLATSPNTDPERYELGTLPYELMAGTTAAVDFIAAIGGPEGTRRERLVRAVEAIDEHETDLREVIETGFAAFGDLTVHSRAARRSPTLFVSVAGGRDQELARFLASRDINAPVSHFYAIEASRRLGLGDGGALRVGLAPYNTRDDADRLLNATADFLASRRP